MTAMNIREGFSADVLADMREHLEDARRTSRGDTEILWVGRVDEEGRVVEVSPAARGSGVSVPALFPHMSRGDAVIHNHPGGVLRPSDADLSTASRLGNQGIGFIIVNDELSDMNVVAAPLPRKETVPLDMERLTGILKPGGGLDMRMESYEPRDGQIAMLGRVASVFNENRHLAAEAGTGIGKSFAYLLPALEWAAANDERVVVSTATIALQQQLMEKDIPLARELLGSETKVALVKGRGNYLCLKRLEEAGVEDDLFGAGGDLKALRSWALTSTDGDISELPFRPSGDVWSRVRCEADACPGPLCGYFEKCFLMKARRRAAESSLLVSNHHLLFADLAARRDGVGEDETAVLPPYRRIILDEAHHAETGASALFTVTLSLPSLNRIFYRLYRRKGARVDGLLQRLAEKCPSLAERFIGEVPPPAEAARRAAELLDIQGRDLLPDGGSLRLAGEPDETERLRFLKPLEELRRALGALIGAFADIMREVDEGAKDPELQALAVEARQSLDGLNKAAGAADSFEHRDEYPEQVFWLERRRRSDGTDHLFCHRTPLSVAPAVREAVWEPFDSVVGVSATLALGGRFDHWKSRIGADRIPREPVEGIFPSPFDFSSRVFLGIPADAPEPGRRDEWENYLVRGIAEAVNLTEGGALILFTSYDTLKKTIIGVRRRLGDSAPILLAQGDDDRGRLLKRFRENPSSVLFATDSFWEGVDVPGSALRLVVITRLPFRPPGDPVAEARREAISAAGGSAFFELTLPEAVTRFRQGFGRLMRRGDDFGAVLVLDPRVCRKAYGRLFLEALPPARRCVKSTEGVFREMEEFLFSREG